MNRGQIVLLVLAIGLGAFYYLHDVKGKPQREEAETKAKRLFPNLKKDDVTEITVEHLKDEGANKKFSRTIRHQHSLWVLEGTEPHVLSTMNMGSVTNTLVSVQKMEELAETPGSKLDPVEFGLDKPTYKVTLKSRDGQTQVLALGDKTPDKNGYYVQGGASNAIERIDTTLPELLETDPDKNRETSLMPFEPSRANKVVWVPAKGDPIVVALAKPREKSADDSPDDGMEITNLSEEWLLRPASEAAKPGSTPTPGASASATPSPGASATPAGADGSRTADGAKIRDNIWAWKNLKHTRFLTLADKIDFSKPLLTMQTWVDGENEPYVIEVGPGLPDKPTLHYVRRRNPDEILLFDIANSKLLEPKAAGFEQKHLAAFEVDEVERVAGKIDSADLAVRRGDPNWKVQMPMDVSTDDKIRDAAINDLLWDIKNTEWKEAAKAPAEWKERAKVQLMDKKDSVIADLSVGPVSGAGALVKTKEGRIYLVEPDPNPKWQGMMKRLQGVPSTPSPSPRPQADLTAQPVPPGGAPNVITIPTTGKTPNP